MYSHDALRLDCIRLETGNVYSMKQWVIGSFEQRAEAETAVERLATLGYGREDVSVMMNGDRRSRDFGSDDSSESIERSDRGASIAKGAAGGGMIGGTIGAIVAAVAGTGAVGLTIVTAGAAAPFIAGPLAAVLAAGGAGAAAGSVIGGLVGAGVPELEAERVDRAVASGNIVVSVLAEDDRVASARFILESSAA